MEPGYHSNASVSSSGNDTSPSVKREPFEIKMANHGSEFPVDMSVMSNPRGDKHSHHHHHQQSRAAAPSHHPTYFPPGTPSMGHYFAAAGMSSLYPNPHHAAAAAASLLAASRHPAPSSSSTHLDPAQQLLAYSGSLKEHHLQRRTSTEGQQQQQQKQPRSPSQSLSQSPHHHHFHHQSPPNNSHNLYQQEQQQYHQQQQQHHQQEHEKSPHNIHSHSRKDKNDSTSSTMPTSPLTSSAQSSSLSNSTKETLLDHRTPGMTGFRIKDSSGKLAILDVLGGGGQPSEGSSDLSDFLPNLTGNQRAKREFVPDNKKDELYWNKRIKNNDSARRSRVKRKTLEKIMETRLMELQKENIELRHEMSALKRRFGIEEDEQSSVSSLSRPISPSRISLASNTPEPTTPLPTPMGRLGNASSSGGDAISQERASSASERELSSREEFDLEQQSAGSDDSHSHDDSRAYNIGSMLALSHSLGPSMMRDRADSFGSGTSSGGRSSRPNSRSSHSGIHSEPSSVRTDKSGALDLTNADNLTNNISTPARDSPLTAESVDGVNEELQKISRKRKAIMSVDGNSSSSSPALVSDSEMDNKKMRGFPLKCRWKKEMRSVAQISPPASTENDRVET